MSTPGVGYALVVGIDPGPTPGLVALHLKDGRLSAVDVAQVSADLLDTLLRAVIGARPVYGDVLVQVERFVVSKRSGRSSSAGAGATTRDMVGSLVQVCTDLGQSQPVTCVTRNASAAKGWATDERLERAGIEIPKGMRHSRDAARHALYAAVHEGHLPDPLSSTYKKPSR